MSESVGVTPIMTMWTIYAAPADFPDVPYVVRGWAVGPGFGEVTATGAIGFADTLDQARGCLPPGLACIQPSPEDDPVIVETWL